MDLTPDKFELFLDEMRFWEKHIILYVFFTMLGNGLLDMLLVESTIFFLFFPWEKENAHEWLKSV